MALHTVLHTWHKLDSYNGLTIVHCFKHLSPYLNADKPAWAAARADGRHIVPDNEVESTQKPPSPLLQWELKKKIREDLRKWHVSEELLNLNKPD